MATRIALYALYLLALLATLMVGFEQYMRHYVYDPSEYYVHQPGWRIRFHASPGIAGLHYDSDVEINRMGLRGRIPNSSDNPKILTVGGSTTEEIILDVPDTWAGQLERGIGRCKPTAWIGNMGRAGTNARHHAMQLEKILPRLPRLDRVVVLAGLNDMLFDFGIHHPDNLPADWDLRQAFTVAPPPDATLLDRSAAIHFLRRIWSQRGRFLDEDAALVRTVDFVSVLARLQERRRQVADEDFIRDLPDMREPLERYRAVLERIVDVTRHQGVPVTFVTQPSLWASTMTDEAKSRLYAGGIHGVDRWFLDPRNKWFDTEPMRIMLESYNKVMLSVCRSKGLLCVDLADALPKTPDMFYDDFHFSQAGSGRVGSILTQALAPDCRR